MPTVSLDGVISVLNELFNLPTDVLKEDIYFKSVSQLRGGPRAGSIPVHPGVEHSSGNICDGENYFSSKS